MRIVCKLDEGGALTYTQKEQEVQRRPSALSPQPYLWLFLRLVSTHSALHPNTRLCLAT